MSPIRITSPAEFVRKHPEMYWGGNRLPGFEDVNAAIADQLRDDGCVDISTYQRGNWQLVCCELDWKKTICEKFGSIGRIFDAAVTIPGPAAGGLRVEWLVTVLSIAVRVWVDGQIAYSQGGSGLGFDGATIPELRGRVCIAYRLRGSEGD